MAARGQGFALGDFDTSWMLDDRFRRLAERLPDFRDCGAAKNMYWEVVAASWREARRVPLHQVFSSPPEDLVAALVDVGLLDHQDRIRRGTFDYWIGNAVRRRKAATARKQKQRHGSESNPNLIQNDSDPRAPDRLSRGTPRDPVSQSGPRDSGTDSSARSGNGRGPGDHARASARPTIEPPAASDWVVLARTVNDLTAGRDLLRPGGISARAIELAESFGVDATIAAMHTAVDGVDQPDARQVVFGAANVLRPIPRANGKPAPGFAHPQEEIDRAVRRSS